MRERERVRVCECVCACVSVCVCAMCVSTHVHIVRCNNLLGDHLFQKFPLIRGKRTSPPKCIVISASNYINSEYEECLGRLKSQAALKLDHLSIHM